MADKQKIELEFLINTSSKILFNCLSTPSGLSEWFADDVNIRNDVYTFIWENGEEKARLLTKRRDEFIKFQWIDDEEDEGDPERVFEFRIKVDPITGETALLVSDYADDDEVEENTKLWETQVDLLRRALGA